MAQTKLEGVVRRDDLELPFFNDCTIFVLHHLGISFKGQPVQDLLKILTKLDKPLDAIPALIAYEDFNSFCRHFGFIMNGRVISKWCSDPVYEHPEVVGNTEGINYYLIPSDKIDHINDLFS